MKFINTIIAAAAFLLMAPSVPAAPVTGAEEREKAVLQCLYGGDYPRLADELEGLISGHPVDPIASLYYRDLFRMADTFGAARTAKTAEKIREAIVRSGDSHAGACLLRLDCDRERLLYRFDAARAKKITDDLNPVRLWTLYGPYRRYGAGDFDYPFQPEVIAASGEIYPQKRIRITEFDGWLDPGKYLYPDNGVVYAKVSFRSRGPLKIRIYTRALYTIFINGSPAARNTEGSRRNVRILLAKSARGISVMVKLYGNPFEKMRMLVTDEHDAVVSPEIVMDTSFYGECDVTELLDYPFEALSAGSDDDPRKAAHLGLYFDALESEEAHGYYRKSIAVKKNAGVSYLLAASLMRSGTDDTGSADYNEGLGIITALGKQDAAFLPARHIKADMLIDGGNYSDAYREGKKLASDMPRSPFSEAIYMRLCNILGYEKEFTAAAALAKTNYPDSALIMEKEADFYKDRDPGKFLEIMRELVKRDFTPERARIVMHEYMSRGDYGPALDLIRTYNFNNDFTDELVEIHIRNKEFKTARNYILQALMANDKPSLYYALGMIDILQSDDPSMYFHKALSISPSRYAISDYLQYLGSGTIENPFARFLDREGGVDFTLFKKEYARYPSAVLYRGRIFILQKDGGSRVYCEDIIQVNDEDGVRRWGDITIPFSGRVHPVRLRVYDGQGTGSDSYLTQKVDSDAHVTIKSLRKNSIIHLSYIVDNPVTTPRGSTLFSLPAEYLQNYDEPVNRASIKVVAPAGMKVNFRFKTPVTVSKSVSEGLHCYTASLEGIPAVKHEPYAGGRMNCLYYYTFSSMEGFSDFVAWYGGLVREKSGALPPQAASFRQEGVDETIAAMYNFVAREIELQDDTMSYLESAGTTLFRKRGSVEDKAILARAMLQGLGIKSYLAFARNKFLPEAGTYASHDYFTSVLLYVPLDIGHALWLDFSNRYYRCGTTAGNIDGAAALVMINDSYRFRKIESRDGGSTAGRYDIDLAEDGSAACSLEVSFFGPRGGIRARFSDSRHIEESAHRYFSGMVTGLKIDSVRVDNLKEYDSPFSLSVRGTGVGIAVAESPRMTLEPVLRKCEVYDYLLSVRRDHPLVIDTAINEKDKYRYTLPERFIGAEVDKTGEVKSRFGNGRIVMTKKRGSPVLEVQKQIQVHSAVIGPAEYGEFLNFCLELKRIESDAVILKP
jgi:hypothetical protein